MDMASLLKGTANLFMTAVLLRRVGRDLAVEVRDDAARSPYGAAGAATVLGIMAGRLIVNRHRRRSRR
jgi:hypothetical protein